MFAQQATTESRTDQDYNEDSIIIRQESADDCLFQFIPTKMATSQSHRQIPASKHATKFLSFRQHSNMIREVFSDDEDDKSPISRIKPLKSIPMKTQMVEQDQIIKNQLDIFENMDGLSNDEQNQNEFFCNYKQDGYVDNQNDESEDQKSVQNLLFFSVSGENNPIEKPKIKSRKSSFNTTNTSNQNYDSKDCDELMEDVFSKLDNQLSQVDAIIEQDEYGNLKRGRKSQSFGEYVDHVETRMAELKVEARDSSDKKARKRKMNQISAYQTRLNRRKEFQYMRNKNYQLTNKLKKVMKLCSKKTSKHVFEEIASIIVDKLDDIEEDLFSESK